MRAPFGGGAHGRLVRAHELMHARVSPLFPLQDAFPDLAPRAVECAEEFRVNCLLARVGLDVHELRDGSERLTGERLAMAGEWTELACFAAALAGTRSLSDLLRGVRRVSPAWAASCRALERALRAAVRRVPTATLGSTWLAASGLPVGFDVHTRRLAELIGVWSRAPVAAATRRRGARPSATGVFAPLILDRNVVLDRTIRGGCVSRRVHAPFGRRVVAPHRLVTDPARRAFDGRRTGRGGVVLVDQSGSMAIGTDELEALLAAAPGAYVLGYSHAPGSVGVPNAWVLADRGRAASSVRAGNVGNGVDGPALRHALLRRRAGEPVVWVCDGQVTDSGDHADPTLAAECAGLARRHGVQMVASVPEAIQRLSGQGPRPGDPRLLGRVGAAVTPGP